MTLRPGIDYLKSATEGTFSIHRVLRGYVTLDYWIVNLHTEQHERKMIPLSSIGPVWTVCDREGKEVKHDG